MASTESRVTIHMAASFDGYIARKDGSVDWMKTSDEFADGDTHRPKFRRIWFAGGAVSGECLRLGLADEVSFSILPILIGNVSSKSRNGVKACGQSISWFSRYGNAVRPTSMGVGIAHC